MRELLDMRMKDPSMYCTAMNKRTDKRKVSQEETGWGEAEACPALVSLNPLIYPPLSSKAHLFTYDRSFAA